MKKFCYLFGFFYCTLFLNIYSIKGQIGCDLNLIRSTFTGAGCTELSGCLSSCSMYFYNPISQTGSAAQAWAQNYGANLISVQSASENTCIINELNNNGFGGTIWIGFNDEATEGNFVWYDQSSVIYTNWSGGEPNNSGNEDCTQIYPNGYWNDLPCTSSGSKSVIEVNLCPVTTITPSATTICAGNNVSLPTSTILGSAPYTYSWTSVPAGFTSTSANPMVTPAVTTTYNVTATDRYGCISQSTVTITVNSPSATISASGPISFCQGGSVDLTVNNATSYSWSNGAASQSITIAATGSFTVVVTDGNGCTATSSPASVTVYNNPVATFNTSNVCYPNAVQFTDSSTTASGTINAWLWNFGDGSPVNTSQSPSHLYANAGTYNVTLIVNNSFGCADTITKSVQVYQNPVAGFTANNVCFGDTVYFSNTSSVDTATSIASYLWLFGDSSPTSSLQTPNHYYSIAGTYTVTLVTTTTDGCSSAATLAVNVFGTPTSAFTFSNTCLFDSAKFTNTSLLPLMGSIASWSWDFGDGSALNTTVWSPHHLYAIPGDYTVTLITHSSNLSCPDTLKDTITVFPMPNADFEFIDVCLNQVMNFNDSSSISGGNSITGWSWNFGDTTPLNTLQNPTHLYANPGTYTVALISTTNYGCKDTITKNTVVHPLPVAQFNTTNVCDGSMVPFSDSSSILPTDILQSWTWNFGDGSLFNTNQNTSHLYAAKGFYSVQLLVVSNFGCSNAATKIVVVNPNPIIKFTADDTVGCEPFCVNFQDSSLIATGTNVARLWNVGDGINNSQSFVHCYSNDSLYSPNFFNVTLTVTSDSGCVSTASKNNYITVYPNPNATFTVQPQTTTITDPVISISNLSTGANYWNWNFGDSATSSVYNPPPHQYADTGTYTIRLITSTLYNCIDTAYETIVIEPDFVFYIPTAFSPNNDGINDSFTAKGILINSYEMRIFDRWGNLIFFSDDMRKPWDGKVPSTEKDTGYGNETLQGEVYVYSIKITDFKKRKHNYTGIVTLIR